MTSNSAENQLLSEVVFVCNSLGHQNKVNNQYILNTKSSSVCIRDLIRFLRHDDQRFLVRKQMGVSDIVQNDLIPIIEQHSIDDISLFDKVLRLLVDLTNPTILHFKQKMPNDKCETQKFLELQSILYSYKLSFGSHKRFWTVLAKHLTRILDLDQHNRQVEDGLMLERILILIRNVLHIPIDTDLVKVTEDGTNPHDRILEVLHSSGINDLILFLCNNGEYQELCFHMIEIISLMFREQNAQFIALSVSNDQQINWFNSDRRSLYERQQDSKELQELRARDRTHLIKSHSNYNRFNGAAYCVKNMKSISDRDLIYHKMPSNLSQISFDANKGIKRKAKNRKPMTENSSNSTSSGAQVIHRSTFRVRKLLHDFCVDFLTNSYNQFMRIISDNLRRHLSQDNDETYYLWAIQFFMEFNRCNPKTDDNSLVAETMSISSFHYLHTQIEHYMDFMKTQKEDLTLWSKRLHYGLRAYRELLFTLGYLDTVKDEKARQLAQLIKSDLFYEAEYRDLLLHLFHDYNEVKMSKAFLKDLIETNHMFLKMLENYSKMNSRLMVRQKLKRRKKRKVSNKKTPIEKTPPEQIWNEVVSTVSDALQGNIELPSPQENTSVRAYDPISDKTIDQQKMEVMRRIHHFLKQKLVIEAIALYRDARNVWSGDEDNAFGAQDILPEDELLSLNEILMTEFPNESPTEEENVEILSEEEQESVESTYRTRERELKFEEVIKKYCHQKVVRNFALLLKSFHTNSSETNHCIIKMLHRIAFDCKMHAMLFQVSIFRIFQRILQDPLVTSPTIEELSKFTKFIVAKFLSVAQKNDKVFIEMLFWKDCREAYEIEEGYDPNINSKTKRKSTINDEEVEEAVDFTKNGEGIEESIDFTKNGEDVEESIDFTKNGEEVEESIDFTKNGEEVEESIDFTKNGEEVEESIDFTKNGEDVEESIDFTKNGEEVEESIDSTKNGEDVESIYFTKNGEEVEESIGSTKNGKEVEESIDSTKNGKEVEESIDSTKNGEEVESIDKSDEEVEENSHFYRKRRRFIIDDEEVEESVDFSKNGEEVESIDDKSDEEVEENSHFYRKRRRLIINDDDDDD